MLDHQARQQKSPRITAGSTDRRSFPGEQRGGRDSSYRLIWGTTVKPNIVADTLVGSTVGLDWLFAQLTGKTADVIDNRNVPGHKHVDNTI